MSIEISDLLEGNGTTVRISAGYSLKVPLDTEYATADGHSGISMEFTVPANADIDNVLSIAKDIEAKLTVQTKLLVFAKLGVDYDTNMSGGLTPVVRGRAQASAAPKKQRSNLPNPYGDDERTPRKASEDAMAALPTITYKGVEYLDQRPLKANGTYKPNAADFRSVEKIDGRYKQEWLTNKDGSPNTALVDALGVSV